MKRQPLVKRSFSFAIIALIFFSPAFLQGCDGMMGSNEPEAHYAAPAKTGKLRHPTLLDAAKRTTTSEAGKAISASTDLFLAFNQYEANGITPRVLNRYEVTERILEEYGITRRILDKYGITRRILDKYGITRRVLNQYDVTRRLISKYGITPRVLSRYGDQVTDELLAELGITAADLANDGVSAADIEAFNTLSALLSEYDLSIEQFIEELEAALSSIRLKVYIDGTARMGIAISMDSEILDAFLDEIGDDPDILFAEPDVTFDTSDLGLVVGSKNKSQITPWGITNVAAPLLEGDSYNNVDVYILDSGSMKNNGWDDLNFVERKDFTMLFENPDQLLWEEDEAPDVSGFDPGSAGNPDDESGHGIHIAGTIGAKDDKIGVVGVAPGVNLHSLKVLTKEGRTDMTTLLAAVDYVTRAKLANPNQPIVVNMSLGVDIGTTEYNVLDEAIEASIAAGVIYVAAAGNNGQNAANYSPAHVKEVITVGAYNEQGAFASFSNFGAVVDILAPGENIVSLSHVLAETKSAEAILASGTSFAAPHVTGAIARYLGAHPLATANEVDAALKNAASETLSGVPSGTFNKALNVKNLFPDTVEDTTDDKKKKKKD